MGPNMQLINYIQWHIFNFSVEVNSIDPSNGNAFSFKKASNMTQVKESVKVEGMLT